MQYDIHDTIAAIASAAGGAARGIVRVSGPATRDIVVRRFKSTGDRPLDTLRRATAVAGHVEVLLDDTAPRSLPCDLFLWPSDRSYTRQPVAEFHTLGSAPLLRALLDALCRAGARLAEPGEFTLRAFLAGRIDLTQAEAVLGVIDAQYDDELGTALRQLAGGLASPLYELRDELLNLLAEVEAGLDFVEEDIAFISADALCTRLDAAAAAIRRIAGQMSSRLTTGELPQVALVGPPNAGKSSLFNALAANAPREAPPSAAPAMVSDRRGTTRDYLTTVIELGGIWCELVDTAGTDTPQDSIGATAQTLSTERRHQATIRIHCVDASADDATRQLRDVLPMCDPTSRADLVVLTKTDRAPNAATALTAQAGVPTILTSSVTGVGLDAFGRAVARLLSDGSLTGDGGCVAATADRCRDSLRLAGEAFDRAAAAAAAQLGDELVAAEIRDALAELGKVVGTVYTDDLLDRIFSGFCIGK